MRAFVGRKTPYNHRISNHATARNRKEMIVEILTGVATSFTNGAGLPQMIRTIRTRSTRDISLRFLIMLVIGLSTWEIYTIVTHQPIFMIGNGFGLCTWSLVLIIKITNKRKNIE